MKKIITLLSGALFATASMAQFDVAVTDLNFYEDNDQIMTNNAGPISVVWENVGSTTINQNDTIFVAFTLNDALLAAPGFLAPQDYPQGAIDTFNYDATTSLPQQTFAGRLGNLRLLAGDDTQIGGNPIGPNRTLEAFLIVIPVGGTPLADANNANDTGVVNFNLVDGDFAATNIQVVAGNLSANNTINVSAGNSLDTISFDVNNNSTLNHFEFLAGIERTINGNVDTLNLQLPRTQTAYGAFTGVINAVDQIGNINMPIDQSQLPQTNGSFDVCVKMIYTVDANPANDQVCETYTIDYSSSIVELENGSGFNSYFVGNVLNINTNGINNEAVRVTNLAGQVIYNGRVNEGLNTININAGSGVFFVTIKGETAKVVKS